MNNGQLTLESMSQAIWYNKWTLSKFEEYLYNDILEIGCGIGNFTNVLMHYGTVYAIDVEKTYVEKTLSATKNKASVGLGNIEKGTYFFKNRTFDTVVCLNVLEHIKNDTKALNNMYKLLKKGGYLILLVPSHQFLYGSIDKAIGHYKRYDKKSLLNLLEKQKFTVIRSRRINSLGAFGWWVSGKILHSKTVSERRLKLFNTIAPTLLRIEDYIEPTVGTSILAIARK